MTASAPLPRSGRLLGGGNSLELLWAMVALAVLTVAAVGIGITWSALWLEGQITGAGWHVPMTQMPGVLAEVLGGHGHPSIHRTVAHPWRPITFGLAMVVALTAASGLGLRRWIDWRSGWRHRQRLRERIRSHSWARRRDLAALLQAPPSAGAPEPPAGGRLLVGSLDGRDVLVPARTSVMVVAPTRTGKSTRLVVPNLLRWDGPAVVTSVKRDVLDLTRDQRAEHGPVALFDPTGATGLPSIRWSPLLTSTTFPDATKTAAWLADAAAVEDRQEAAKFWQTLATKLLAPMLFAAARTGRTMQHVSHWVDTSAFKEVDRLLKEQGDTDAIAAWKAIEGLPNETRGSVLGTAMAIFRAFGSPRVQQATSCTPGEVDNTLNVPELLRENGTLYLVSPEYEQAELRPVFVALVQAVYRAAVEISANRLGGAPLNPPLLLMLDEAGNIAPLHSLPKIASTGAGQGISLMTIWQDRAQIRELFGEAERTVISNHTTSVWLPGSQDIDTLKLLSDLVGDQWVAASTVSSAPDGGVSVSEGSERIDVAPPAFLRTLDHGTAVMLTGNLPPALVRTHAYFELSRWRRLVDEDVLARHAQMHDGTARTTREIFDETPWDDALPGRPPEPERAAGPEGTTVPRGALSRAVGGSHPPVRCSEIARRRYGPAAEGVPRRLSGAPGAWGKVELPPELRPRLSHAEEVDLRDPQIRNWVLPVWLEGGPADALAAHLTFPLLQAEWERLPLEPALREVWEACFPLRRKPVSVDTPPPGRGGA